MISASVVLGFFKKKSCSRRGRERERGGVSVPVVLVFKSGDLEGQGRILDAAVGEEPRGVACCMGSGTVVLKHSAIQRWMHKIK